MRNKPNNSMYPNYKHHQKFINQKSPLHQKYIYDNVGYFLSMVYEIH